MRTTQHKVVLPFMEALVAGGQEVVFYFSSSLCASELQQSPLLLKRVLILSGTPIFLGVSSLSKAL